MFQNALTFSLLLSAAYLFSPVFSQVDSTYTELATGKDVTEAVIRRISNSEIFPHDHSFLIRLAYVESQFGTLNSTFRGNYTGGIWQVDEAFFTRTLDTALTSYHDAIEAKFNIKWRDLTWKSCLAPMYSGIAVALYFTQFGEPFPDKLSDQADQWILRYRPAGDSAKFIEDSNELSDQRVCRGKMDLVMALDGSGSVGALNYIKAKNVVAEIIESFTLDFTRIGMFVFSDNMHTILNLNENLTISEMAEWARYAYYPSGGTRTDLAIMRAIDLHNNVTRVDGVPRIVAVLTDGQSTGPSLAGAVDEMARNGLLPISIGITNQINYDELKLIALNNTRMVFTVSDFDALHDFLYEITSTLCEIPQKPATETNYEDYLVANERRLYELPITENGLTIRVEGSSGKVAAYWSRTEQVPSSAVHDGVIDGYTFIPADTKTEGLLNAASAHIYVAVQGEEVLNAYTFTTVEGDQDITDSPSTTTTYPECPTPEPEPCNCCDRCPKKPPQEVHHHHYYYRDPSAPKHEEYSFPH